MTDFHELLSNLRRPDMLIRAARHGAGHYRRDRHLKRLMGENTAPTPERLLPRLLSEEEQLEQIRQSGDADYSITRHIEVLIALLAEVQLLPRAATA